MVGHMLSVFEAPSSTAGTDTAWCGLGGTLSTEYSGWQHWVSLIGVAQALHAPASEQPKEQLLHKKEPGKSKRQETMPLV